MDIANLLELGVVQQIAEQHGAIQHQQFDQGMIPIDPEDVDLHHAGIIHQVGNHHILPPIELAHGNTLQSHIENFLNNLAHQGIAAPTSIIIPYNPGGHWVTVHIQITDNQIKLLYIESLLGFQDRKNRLEIGQKMETLRNFLEVRYERHTIIDIVYRKLQSDSYACGPITVEVVQEIAFNALIPALPQQLNAAAIMVLRDRHVQLLHEHGRDLDFDPI